MASEKKAVEKEVAESQVKGNAEENRWYHIFRRGRKEFHRNRRSVI